MPEIDNRWWRHARFQDRVLAPLVGVLIGAVLALPIVVAIVIWGPIKGVC